MIEEGARRATAIGAAEIDALTVRQQIAIGMRVLERGGFCQDVAGQIVVRDPQRPGAYLTNPWGFTWDGLRASDVVSVDERMQVLDGPPGLVSSGSLELQFGILRRRADVGVVLHNHPPLATAWSATRRPVRALDQTSAIFFERQAWCAEFEDSSTSTIRHTSGAPARRWGPTRTCCGWCTTA